MLVHRRASKKEKPNMGVFTIHERTKWQAQLRGGILVSGDKGVNSRRTSITLVELGKECGGGPKNSLKEGKRQSPKFPRWSPKLSGGKDCLRSDPANNQKTGVHKGGERFQRGDYEVRARPANKETDAQGGGE